MRICYEKSLSWWNLGGNSENRKGMHHIISPSWKLHHLLIYSKAWCHMDVGRYKGSRPHIINKYANSQPASQAVYEFCRLLITSRGGSPGLSLSVYVKLTVQEEIQQNLTSAAKCQESERWCQGLRDEGCRGRRVCLFSCFEVYTRAHCNSVQHDLCSSSWWSDKLMPIYSKVLKGRKCNAGKCLHLKSKFTLQKN